MTEESKSHGLARESSLRAGSGEPLAAAACIALHCCGRLWVRQRRATHLLSPVSQMTFGSIKTQAKPAQTLLQATSPSPSSPEVVRERSQKVVGALTSRQNSGTRGAMHLWLLWGG